ncbi:hypothetical protein, partial [Trichocoleus sp. Lan]|uniref:hypothetical protein n=1 Tax=Trichocoleus sp. Lan TaxID=2933927 RepID=UPI00329978D7
MGLFDQEEIGTPKITISQLLPTKITSVRDKEKAKSLAQQGLQPIYLMSQKEKEGDNAENLK